MHGVIPHSFFFPDCRKIPLFWLIVTGTTAYENTLKSTENALKKPSKYLEKTMLIWLWTLSPSPPVPIKLYPFHTFQAQTNLPRPCHNPVPTRRCGQLCGQLRNKNLEMRGSFLDLNAENINFSRGLTTPIFFKLFRLENCGVFVDN